MTSVYLHIPFCSRKCFYCSFSVAVGQKTFTGRYVDCLIQEAQGYNPADVFSVYWGGGTPSTLSAPETVRLNDAMSLRFERSGIQEKTIEVNPEDVDEDKANLIKDLKFSRLSLGIQSFDDHRLKYLGRAHNSRQALKAFDILRRAGHENINVDLIYGLPGQTLDDIKQDMKTLQALSCEHVSLYSLTVEERSRFFVKKIQPLPADEQVLQYQWAMDFLSNHGFHQYEISNFSKPGKESLHNLHYWHGGNYIGFGPAAHSHHDGKRSWNVDRLKEYISRMVGSQSPLGGFEVLDLQRRLMERIVFGLRLNSGIHIEEVQRQYQQKVPQQKWDKIQEFISGGFLSYDPPMLKFTPQGQLVLDELSSYLV